MIVERGAEWGGRGALPADGVVVRSDAEARAVVTEHRRRGEPIPPLGLLGGDLCRTLGGGGAAGGGEARLRSPDATTLSVDLGAVLVDGRLHWFVAHLVARRSWWRGLLVAVMNAEWLGEWDVAPRAHPGDGRLDLVEADPPLRDRLQARRRLRTGTHVPHPDITVRRVRAWQAELPRPLDVHLDGERVGRARALSVRVEHDALTVVV